MTFISNCDSSVQCSGEIETKNIFKMYALHCAGLFVTRTGATVECRAAFGAVLVKWLGTCSFVAWWLISD